MPAVLDQDDDDPDALDEAGFSGKDRGEAERDAERDLVDGDEDDDDRRQSDR